MAKNGKEPRMFGKIVANIDCYGQASETRPGEWTPMWCVHFNDGTEKRCSVSHFVACMNEADAKSVARQHADHWLYTRSVSPIVAQHALRNSELTD